MIFSTEPADWKDLQNKVGEILRDCGLSVEIEKVITSVRGKIEVDVFAKEIVNKRDNVIIIECKYWNNPIPQTVIHSFRTVIADIGGNIGYIISKKGFQRGSYDAVGFSNIKLLWWEEFQELFEEQWCENYLSKYIEDHWSGLITYTEPLVPEWIHKLEGELFEEYKIIRNKYEELGWVLLYLKSPARIFSKLPPPQLPLGKDCEYGNIPEELKMVKGYKEMIKALHKYCDPALEEYNKLKRKAERKNA